jgi:putative ABC transport system substrate-binding protein
MRSRELIKSPRRLIVDHAVPDGPTASVIAALISPANRSTAEPQSRDLQAAARTLGLQLHVVHASTERDFDTVFASLARLRPGALVIGSDAFFISQNEQLATLAVRHAMPAIFQDHAFTAPGGLMSYGGSLPEAYRQAGIYTGRILKGEKPADLPVIQSTKFELIINYDGASRRSSRCSGRPSRSPAG